MSHKMFYSEIKERESILQLINATVSHELRNPLSAIISQVTQLKVLLDYLKSLIEALRMIKGMKSIMERLETFYKRVDASIVRISFTSQFIEFFVNDMLDFAVLQKSNQNFIKQN